MPKAPIALTLGSYESRSLTAEAQRCVNLYPEKNPEDASFPFTLYPVPGLTTLCSPDAPAPGRGLYLASNGKLFAAAGNLVYQVAPTTWNLTAIGQLLTNSKSPVSMRDNSSDLVVADGGGTLYSCDLTKQVLRPVADKNQFGSDGVDLIDGFLIFNLPSSRDWYSSLDNEVAFDPTYLAAKNGSNDLLQRVVAVHREAWLIGENTSEVWYDAGDVGLPFNIIPGAFIQHGTPAKHSVACWDSAVFFLAQSPQGGAYVMQGMNYEARPVSTSAISEIFSKYSVLSDAIGFCYEQAGHAFYCLTFPHADATWVYDISQGLWHERAWFDSSGRKHRFRPNSIISAFGKVIAQDWENGALYEMVEGVFTDTQTATAGSFIYPYPALPDPPLTDNEIVAFNNPTAMDGLTAQNCLPDWDNDLAYVSIDRTDPTTGGIYISKISTGAAVFQKLMGYFPLAGVGSAAAMSKDYLFYPRTPIGNYTTIYQVKKDTLNLVGAFGKAGSGDGGDPVNTVYYPTVGLACQRVSNGNEYLFTGVANFTNKVMQIKPGGLQPVSQIGVDHSGNFTLALTDGFPFAGEVTSSYSRMYYFNADHASPYTVFKLYAWDIFAGESADRFELVHLMDLTPTMVDPGWVNFFQLESYGFDGTDNTVLIAVSKFTGTGSHDHYLVKINPVNGLVVWTIGLAGTVKNYLALSRITYGLLGLYVGSTVYIVDTVLGTIVQTFPYTGLSQPAGIMFDDTTGKTVLCTGYSKGGANINPAAGTPDNFGGAGSAGTGWWASLTWHDNWFAGGANLIPAGGTSTPRGSFPVAGATEPNQMVFIRSFPHLLAGGGRLLLNSFLAKLDGGRTSAEQQAVEPAVSGQTISLRYSADGGQSWGQAVPVSLGETGEFNTAPIWRRLGISAGRDYVFEVSWAGGGIRALLGAWLDAEGLDA